MMREEQNRQAAKPGGICSANHSQKMKETSNCGTAAQSRPLTAPPANRTFSEPKPLRRRTQL